MSINSLRLNTAQSAAVSYNQGPLMILAGAGSGKTKTLVAKMVHLLEEKHFRPYELLALTFSNKAASEMRERVMRETGIPEKMLYVTTFHSFCARLLRQEAMHLGLSQHFVIYDDSESKEVIKNILQQTQDESGFKKNMVYDVAAFIDEVKNKGFYIGRMGENPFASHPYFPLFQKYEEELHRSNALDFGSLITTVLQLFEKNPSIKEIYQRRFRYILIDEYQDTNRAQFELMVHLSEKHRQICVVGDEDQSIYSWRGADINNIFDFQKIFHEYHLVKLEQNYRSSQHIVRGASSVIAHNELRSDKKLWTENPLGERITLTESDTDENEALYVATQITKLKQRGIAFEEMAVFYRNNAQSRLVEDALRRSNIPHKIIGGIRFYDRKEIKDILAYLKLIQNPKDTLSLTRVINVPPRGIGTTTMKKLDDLAQEEKKSLWEVLSERSYSFKLRLGPKIAKALEIFTALIEELQSEVLKNRPLSELYELLLEGSDLLAFYKSSKDYESQARVENLQEFQNLLKKFEKDSGERNSLAAFLELLTLDHSSAGSDEKVQDDTQVSLMTIHGAKGLEFDYVFVVGTEQNIFPSFRSYEKGQQGIEEERRLFYVAMTRARKELTLCFARSRMMYGQWQFNDPSCFIMEIPKDHIKDEIFPEKSFKTKVYERREVFQQTEEEVSFQKTKKIVPITSRTTTTPPTATSGKKGLQKGMNVTHAHFGKGFIVAIEGQGDDEKVIIMFQSGERKRFLTRIAPLTF